MMVWCPQSKGCDPIEVIRAELEQKLVFESPKASENISSDALIMLATTVMRKKGS